MPPVWDSESEKLFIMALLLQDNTDISGAKFARAAEMMPGNHTGNALRMAPTWDDSRDKELLMRLFVTDDCQITRAQAAQIGQAMGYSADTTRPVLNKPKFRLTLVMAIWDDAKEKQFLLVLLSKAAADFNVKEVTAEVAQLLGPQYSAETCRQKFYKLKKDAEGMLSGSAPATPGEKKKAKPATPKSASTGKKRGRKPANGNDNVEDDPLDEETPTKKPKKAEIKSETANVKAEEDGNEEELSEEAAQEQD